MTQLKLEVGKWYQTRDKRVKQITSQSQDKHVVDPFRCNSGIDYYPDGSYSTGRASGHDLVKEITKMEDVIGLIHTEGLAFAMQSSFEGADLAIVTADKEDVAVAYCDKQDSLFDTLIKLYLDYKLTTRLNTSVLSL